MTLISPRPAAGQGRDRGAAEWRRARQPHPDDAAGHAPPPWGIRPAEALVLGGVGLLLFRSQLRELLDAPRLRTWETVFVSISLQALPFLVLGVTVSALIAVLVSPRALDRVLPRRPVLAVPAAALAGTALPGCECSSVPIAGRLVERGAMPAAALTFQLAAPAINPVVIASTAVAFPGRPEMVVARFVASAATAMVVGWIWLRLGRTDHLTRVHRHTAGAEGRWRQFRDVALHDFLHAGGFLVVGAAAAATLRAFVPESALDAVASSGVLAVLALTLLAVTLSICSEADAFVAASLRQFSPTSQLAFMVVGPVVDLKLVALQVGTFGREFALRFAPLALGVAVASAVVVGTVLL